MICKQELRLRVYLLAKPTVDCVIRVNSYTDSNVSEVLLYKQRKKRHCNNNNCEKRDEENNITKRNGKKIVGFFSSCINHKRFWSKRANARSYCKIKTFSLFLPYVVDISTVQSSPSALYSFIAFARSPKFESNFYMIYLKYSRREQLAKEEAKTRTQLRHNDIRIANEQQIMIVVEIFAHLCRDADAAKLLANPELYLSVVCTAVRHVFWFLLLVTLHSDTICYAAVFCEPM